MNLSLIPAGRRPRRGHGADEHQRPAQGAGAAGGGGARARRCAARPRPPHALQRAQGAQAEHGAVVSHTGDKLKIHLPKIIYLGDQHSFNWKQSAHYCSSRIINERISIHPKTVAG